MARQGGFVSPIMQRYMLDGTDEGVPSSCNIEIDVLGVLLDVSFDETVYKPGDKVSFRIDSAMSPLLRLMANHLDQTATPKKGK